MSPMSSPLIIIVDLRLPDDYITINNFAVEALGDELYRIAEVPSVLDGGGFEYGDIVELVACEDGEYDLRSIKQRGNWRRFDLLVPVEYLKSEGGVRLISQIEAFGGVWVHDAGGILSIVLPPEITWAPPPD